MWSWKYNAVLTCCGVPKVKLMSRSGFTSIDLLDAWKISRYRWLVYNSCIEWKIPMSPADKTVASSIEVQILCIKNSCWICVYDNQHLFNQLTGCLLIQYGKIYLFLVGKLNKNILPPTNFKHLSGIFLQPNCLKYNKFDGYTYQKKSIVKTFCKRIV